MIHLEDIRAVGRLCACPTSQAPRPVRGRLMASEVPISAALMPGGVSGDPRQEAKTVSTHTQASRIASSRWNSSPSVVETCSDSKRKSTNQLREDVLIVVQRGGSILLAERLRIGARMATGAPQVARSSRGRQSSRLRYASYGKRLDSTCQRPASTTGAAGRATHLRSLVTTRSTMRPSACGTTRTRNTRPSCTVPGCGSLGTRSLGSGDLGYPLTDHAGAILEHSVAARFADQLAP